MFQSALTLAQKDLRGFFRDRGALLACLLVPIMLVTVFGAIMTYAFGGSSSGMPQVSLHLYDADQTDESKRFATSLAAVDMLKVRPLEPADLAGEALQKQLKGLVSSGDAHHILLLPKGFGEAMQSEGKPQMQMFRDPGRVMEDQIVKIGVLQATLAQSGSQIWTDAMVGMLEKQGMNSPQVESVAGWMGSIGDTIGAFQETKQSTAPAQPDEAAVKAAATKESASGDAAEASGLSMDALFEFFRDAVPMETTDVAPPGRKASVTYQQAQSVAGMSVMMLLFALTSCGSVLLAEREDGTLRRLFAQPISRNSILLGKFFFVFVIGVLQLSVLFVYGELVFGVGLFRDPATLVVLSVTWIAAGSTFGMFLASACKSAKQSEGLATLLILMMAALGGCWFPLQMMQLPTWLELICKSTMTYWAMAGYQGMLWDQMAFYEPNMRIALAWQWAWIGVFGSASVFLFRRNYIAG